MIIYNKKLDIIADLDKWSFQYYKTSGVIRLTNDENPDQEFYYKSLEEFRKEWVDYVPKKPVIIDKHPRNAVKEWLTVNGGGSEVSIRYDNEFEVFVFQNKHGQCIDLKDVSLTTYDFNRFFTEEELCGGEDEAYFKYMAMHPELIDM